MEEGEDDEEICCQCVFEDDCLYADVNFDDLRNSRYGCSVKECENKFFPVCIENLPLDFGVGDCKSSFPCRQHYPNWLTKKRQELGLIPKVYGTESSTNEDGNIIVVDLASSEDQEETENELDITFNSYCTDLVESVRYFLYIFINKIFNY
jgi:hypothetical protein